MLTGLILGMVLGLAVGWVLLLGTKPSFSTDYRVSNHTNHIRKVLLLTVLGR